MTGKRHLEVDLHEPEVSRVAVEAVDADDEVVSSRHWLERRPPLKGKMVEVGDGRGKATNVAKENSGKRERRLELLLGLDEVDGVFVDRGHQLLENLLLGLAVDRRRRRRKIAGQLTNGSVRVKLAAAEKEGRHLHISGFIKFCRQPYFASLGSVFDSMQSPVRSTIKRLF
jgi:hypothetical protein